MRKRSYLIIAIICFILSALLATIAWSQTVIHQTIPGTTIRDYDAPSLVIQPDGTGYQTIPSTTIRDYDAPGIIIQGGNDAGIIGNQYRIDQPLRKTMPHVWPQTD